MRFKRRVAYEHGLSQMDTVPLVNMVFLLLLFVMLIVGFAGLPGVHIGLPGAATSANLQSRSLEIVIDTQGGVFYKARKIPAAELKDLLLKLPLSKTTVLIKADKAAPLASVMRVWKICQELGLRQVNVATTRE